MVRTGQEEACGLSSPGEAEPPLRMTLATRPEFRTQFKTQSSLWLIL
jgi:hypothetical protein